VRWCRGRRRRGAGSDAPGTATPAHARMRTHGLWLRSAGVGADGESCSESEHRGRPCHLEKRARGRARAPRPRPRPCRARGRRHWAAPGLLGPLPPCGRVPRDEARAAGDEVGAPGRGAAARAGLITGSSERRPRTLRTAQAVRSGCAMPCHRRRRRRRRLLFLSFPLPFLFCTKHFVQRFKFGRRVARSGPAAWI
jgi:hypothetical protein